MARRVRLASDINLCLHQARAWRASGIQNGNHHNHFVIIISMAVRGVIFAFVFV